MYTEHRVPLAIDAICTSAAAFNGCLVRLVDGRWEND
jgi:hypothetical protein